MCESSASILVVEDHPDTLTVLGMVLELLGHRPILARDAGSALARAAHEPFDAILTDINLPGRDGWTLLQELTARGQRPKVAISMSAGDDFIQAKRSKAEGCQAHLVKPFRHSELENALNQYLPRPATVAWHTGRKTLR